MRTSRRTRLTVAGLACLGALVACTPGADRADDPAPSASPSTDESASGSPTPSPSESPSESTPSSPSASPTPTEEPEPTSADARVRRVPDSQWRRMVNAGMAYEGCPVGQADLRRVEVNFHSFAGDVRRGVLVVNRDVARSIARIFTVLFDREFPIRRMEPVERYDGDVNVSLRADNTSAYNCRRPDQINAPQRESPHANGRAIDINPRENPWIDLRCDCWSPTARFEERTPGKGKILQGGLVWRTFLAEGWIWQNIDVPDYMHFDTGFPSRPFTGQGRNG